MTNLHKVRLRYPAVSVDDPAFAHVLGRQFARCMNKLACLRLVRAVDDWLVGSGRLDDLVNLYDNTDDDLGHGEVVVLLASRDTALMMKLALA